MKQAHRFSGPGKAYEGLTRLGPNGPTWTGAIRLVEDALTEPLHWRKPQRIFVNSMSDLFHDDVPDAFIDRVFAVMALAGRHVFQVLTKRPERMQQYMALLSDRSGGTLNAAYRLVPMMKDIGKGQPWQAAWPLPNVWLGTSVENQKYADERIPLLLQTPAAVRFISAEPLLGPVDLREVREPGYDRNALDVNDLQPPWTANARLDWVIVGGESGPSSRPFDVAWARSIVQQCQAAGVACFVKQLGARPDGWWTNELGPRLNRHALNDKKGGDPSEWPIDLRVRQFPETR